MFCATSTYLYDQDEYSPFAICSSHLPRLMKVISIGVVSNNTLGLSSVCIMIAATSTPTE